MNVLIIKSCAAIYNILTKKIISGKKCIESFVEATLDVEFEKNICICLIIFYEMVIRRTFLLNMNWNYLNKYTNIRKYFNTSL